MERRSRYAKAIESVDAPPPPPERVDGSGEDEIFDLTELAAITKLKETSPLTRIASYYYAKQGRDLPLLERTLDSVSCSDFADMCNTFATFGTNRWPLSDMGTLDSLKYEQFRHLAVHVLKASIVGPRVAAVDAFTDYSLLDHVRTLSGVVVRAGRNIGEAEVDIPGWNKFISVSIIAPTVGKVLSGAEEYLMWRKETQDLPSEYRPAPGVVRVIARYMATHNVMEVGKDGKFRIIPRNPPSDKKLGLKIPSPPLQLSRMEVVIKAMITDEYNEKTSVPSGLSAKTAPIDLMAWHLTAAFNKGEESDKEYIRAMARAIQAYGQVAVDSVASVAKTATPQGVFSGNLPRLGLQSPISHGAVFAYVEAHRTTIRATPAIDAPRKSDSTDLGRVLGSATSVPDKIGTAMDQVTRGEKIGVVHAYGTKTNWMEKTVRERAQVVHWFDIDPLNKVDSGVFAVKDIMQLKGGEGRGSFLVDDTYVADSEAKLRVIINASYEGFVTKMILGKGSDKTTIVGCDVTAATHDAIQKYHLQWSRGGGDHSPEYFLTGSLRKKPATEKEVDDCMLGIQDDIIEQVSRMLRQNLLRSAEVWAGCVVPDPEWVDPPRQCRFPIPVSGRVGAKAPTVDVPATPDPSSLRKGSRYNTSSPAAPPGQFVVKSQLNGVNGEATNKDDVVNWCSLETLRMLRDWLPQLTSKYPALYPVEMPYGSVWVMEPPTRGASAGIKLQGFKECVPGMLYSIGRIFSGVMYVFAQSSVSPRVCCYLPSARETSVQEYDAHSLVLVGNLGRMVHEYDGVGLYQSEWARATVKQEKD